MSLKLILLPSALVLAIIVGIFMVYPEYQTITAKGTGKMDILKQKEADLSSKQQMKENGEKLAGQIKSEKSTGVARMLETLPRLSEEERVVVMVDHSARTAGASLTDIGVTAGKEETAPVTAPTQEKAFALGEEVSEDPDMMGGAVPQSVETLKTSAVSVTFSVIGSYESFKQFISELEKMPRKNTITDLQITRKTEDGQNTFEMSGTASFEYAPIANISAGTISSVFSETSFNFSSLSSTRGQEAYRDALEVIPAERPNPFVL